MSIRRRSTKISAEPAAPSQAGPRLDGFRVVARRMSLLTTNLLASAVVLIAGLGLGREVIQWWRAEPPVLPAPAIAGPDDPAGQALEFGDAAFTMNSEPFVGPREAMLAELRRKCGAAAQASGPPSQPAGAAERTFLARTATQAPVQEQAGYRLYEWTQTLTIVAAVREFAAPGEPAAAEPRAVVWGFALPAGADRWTFYVFRTAAGQADGRLAEAPLPPGAQRSMSLRSRQGTTLAAFRGLDQVERWVVFYQQWFRDQGWEAVEEWRATSGRWHAAFATGRTRVDVELGADSRGNLTGLLISQPRSTAQSGS